MKTRCALVVTPRRLATPPPPQAHAGALRSEAKADTPISRPILNVRFITHPPKEAQRYRILLALGHARQRFPSACPNPARALTARACPLAAPSGRPIAITMLRPRGVHDAQQRLPRELWTTPVDGDSSSHRSHLHSVTRGDAELQEAC